MGMHQKQLERRQFGRRQILVHALMIMRGRPAILCIMRDISEGGALLEVEHPEWVPRRFRLVVEASGFDVECEVVRRIGTAIGVRFALPTPFSG